QIGGLHPADVVLRGRQPAADLLQRGRDDLNVEQGHEHPDAHHRKRDDRTNGGAHLTCPESLSATGSRMSTVAVTDNPGRNTPSVPSPSAIWMRTGTRW